MLKPSIDDLLEEINSKFALTIVIAKRARQLQLSPEDYKIENPVGKANNEVARALEELYADDLEYYLDKESLLAAQTNIENGPIAQQDEPLSFETEE